MYHEELIRKPELQILLNVLDEVEVSFPLYELPLIRARRWENGYIVDALAGYHDFSKAMHGIEHLSHELPTYSDFYETFMASGIILYDNVDEFKRSLELYDYLKKGVAFAPDTNVLYHRFISNFRQLDGYQIVIAEGVKKEVENAMNYKYRRNQLDEMKRAVKNSWLLKELSNRRVKKSRKAAYIALKEFERLKDRVVIAENVNEIAHNNDEIIVKSLKRYDDISPVLVVFLTADVAVTDVAEMEGLEYFLFQYPSASIGRHSVSAYQLRTLLFNLAAVFGVIEVNGTLIFGEFGGKRGLNELKLVFGKEDRIYNEFGFHLRLSRKLMGIMRGWNS
ncbi:PIN domain-containing protein [Thermococcus sp.]|uniref:PIN domain-containing protein n=1 Tax=Thermococcus sp. TaxID=35749 RepID=UPI002627D891|nr:PIN domain-containing protein [Thermococcus sp.]